MITTWLIHKCPQEWIKSTHVTYAVVINIFFIIDIGYNLSTTHELENEKQQIKHFLEPNIDVVKSNALLYT